MASRVTVLVVGGTGIDYTVRGDALPSPGRPVTGAAFLRDVGGKGLNQAVAAARLGAMTALISCVGDDPSGDDVLQALAEDGVDANAVVRVAGALTARTLINIDTHGQKQTASYPAANRALVGPLGPEFFNGADIVLAQLEIPMPTVREAGRRARDAGLAFVLDAAPATQVPDELIELAGAVTVNGEEAGMLSGIEVDDRESAVAAAHAIRTRGARQVSVGIPEGRAVVSEAGEHWLPGHHVAVVDTTGAGDACAAGIAVGLAEGRNFLDACALGHAAAALSTTILGARASLPSRAEVDALLSRRRGA